MKKTYALWAGLTFKKDTPAEVIDEFENKACEVAGDKYAVYYFEPDGFYAWNAIGALNEAADKINEIFKYISPYIQQDAYVGHVYPLDGDSDDMVYIYNDAAEGPMYTSCRRPYDIDEGE